MIEIMRWKEKHPEVYLGIYFDNHYRRKMIVHVVLKGVGDGAFDIDTGSVLQDAKTNESAEEMFEKTIIQNIEEVVSRIRR